MSMTTDVSNEFEQPAADSTSIRTKNVDGTQSAVVSSTAPGVQDLETGTSCTQSAGDSNAESMSSVASLFESLEEKLPASLLLRKCHLCAREFNSVAAKDMHLAEHDQMVYWCYDPSCGYKYTKKELGALQAHLRYWHDGHILAKEHAYEFFIDTQARDQAREEIENKKRKGKKENKKKQSTENEGTNCTASQSNSKAKNTSPETKATDAGTEIINGSEKKKSSKAKRNKLSDFQKDTSKIAGENKMKSEKANKVAGKEEKTKDDARKEVKKTKERQRDKKTADKPFEEETKAGKQGKVLHPHTGSRGASRAESSSSEDVSAGKGRKRKPSESGEIQHKSAKKVKHDKSRDGRRKIEQEEDQSQKSEHEIGPKGGKAKKRARQSSAAEEHSDLFTPKKPRVERPQSVTNRNIKTSAKKNPAKRKILVEPEPLFSPDAIVTRKRPSSVSREKRERKEH